MRCGEVKVGERRLGEKVIRKSGRVGFEDWAFGGQENKVCAIVVPES